MAVFLCDIYIKSIGKTIPSHNLMEGLQRYYKFTL